MTGRENGWKKGEGGRENEVMNGARYEGKR